MIIGIAVIVVAAAVFAVAARARRNGSAAPTAMTNTTAGPVLHAPATSTMPLLTATSRVATANANIGPKIEFATPSHEFGKVKSGEVVKYTYVFTNTGGATLVVSNVQTSCGCTTAGEWSRQVEPGRTGNIPIEFNTSGYGSQVTKNITVSCNDTNRPMVVLEITGTVWKPVDAIPQFAVLNVTSESPSNATTVRIVNNEDTPLTLGPPEVNNPAFAAELTTNQPGKEYQLVIRTVPPLPSSSVSAQINLKTSSTNLQVLTINAWANVQPAVAVAPTAITLPPPPLTNPMPAVVSVQNYGTNTLTLSDPAVNAKGVEVRLNEQQPGRFFILNLNFPAGFEIAQGQQVELTVKSSHPQYPVIRVPVVQVPRPAPPAPAATSAPPAAVQH